MAAQSGHIETAKLLLAKGAEVNAGMDAGETTALHWAAGSGNRPMVELLIASGAEVNAKMLPRNWTPLHYAIRLLGRGDVEELLLSAGADANARDDQGLTASDWKTLKDLCDAIMKGGDLQQLRALIGGNLTLVRAHNWGDGWMTALHFAVGWNRAEVVEFLLGNQADVNAANHAGETALHLAASGNRKYIAELLLAKNPNVNAKRNDGLTPLDQAVRKGHNEVAELLRQRGGQSSGRPATSAPATPAQMGVPKMTKPDLSRIYVVSARLQEQEILKDISQPPTSDTDAVEAIRADLTRTFARHLDRYKAATNDPIMLDVLARVALVYRGVDRMVAGKVVMSLRDGDMHSFSWNDPVKRIRFVASTVPCAAGQERAWFGRSPSGGYLDHLGRILLLPEAYEPANAEGIELLAHLVVVADAESHPGSSVSVQILVH